MEIRKIPYKSKFPGGLQTLMDEDLINRPIQHNRNTRWTQGVDIDYHLGWDMQTLEEHKNTLLLALFQEAERYKAKYPECGFWGKVYFKIKGKKDLPTPIGVRTTLEPDYLIWGSKTGTKAYHMERALDQLTSDKYETTARLLGIMLRVYQRME